MKSRLSAKDAEKKKELIPGRNCGYPTENLGGPRGAPQIPPLRSPGFPVELDGVGALHAPFPYRKAHTRPCPMLRGRKSGYAPAGMTILSRPFGTKCRVLAQGLESRDDDRPIPELWYGPEKISLLG
jgi:hypothetical protein